MSNKIDQLIGPVFSNDQKHQNHKSQNKIGQNDNEIDEDSFISSRELHSGVDSSTGIWKELTNIVLKALKNLSKA